MRRVQGYHWIGLSLALALACSSGEKGSGNPAAGGATASGGAGGATASGGAGGAGAGGTGLVPTGGRGPAITMAPPSWAPPANCNGVGEKCQGILSCNGTAMCQTEGDVCIPPIPAGMPLLPSQSAERPYCLAYTCMTYEEASCFCTGEAGKQYPSCKTGPAAVAGICNGEGSACGTAPGNKECCGGLQCSLTNATSGTCRKTCTTGTDCDTGCCTDVKDNGQLVCAPASACTNPCKKRGEACQANGGDCCNGTCVTSTDPDQAGCRPVCNKNEDCDTGCCQLFQNASYGFCAPTITCTGCKADSECATQCCIKPSDLDHALCVDSKFCACANEGAECAGETDIFRCCNDGVCSRPSTSTGPYTCNKKCRSAADCPGACCGTFFQGEDYGVCRAPSECN